MPPMEADAAYQGCLPSCELHSRSLAVGRTGKVRRLCTCVTQSPDCTDSQIARNIYTVLSRDCNPEIAQYIHVLQHACDRQLHVAID